MRHQRGEHATGSALREFDAGDHPVEDVRAGDAAVLLGEPEPEQPDRGGLRVEFAREAAGLVPVGDVWRDLARDEAAHRLAEFEVVVAVPAAAEFEGFHPGMLGADSRAWQARGRLESV